MFNLKTNLCTGLRISMSLEIFKSITWNWSELTTVFQSFNEVKF
jgi:hypothetical protein